MYYRCDFGHQHIMNEVCDCPSKYGNPIAFWSFLSKVGVKSPTQQDRDVFMVNKQLGYEPGLLYTNFQRDQWVKRTIERLSKEEVLALRDQAESELSFYSQANKTTKAWYLSFLVRNKYKCPF